MMRDSDEGSHWSFAQSVEMSAVRREKSGDRIWKMAASVNVRL